MDARCSSVSPDRNSPKASFPCPSWHRTAAPVPWFAMTVMHLHPLRHEVPSTPIRTSPPGTGGRASESLASTLEHIGPTVRQDTLMSFWQATLPIGSAHQQQVSSEAYASRDPCAAQGTSLAAVPHSGHGTLKASLRTCAFIPPTSQHLQSRTPRPASYRGAPLPHFPHLHDRALYGSASMARAPAPSIAMPRTLIPSAPTMLFANLLMCTPPPLADL